MPSRLNYVIFFTKMRDRGLRKEEEKKEKGEEEEKEDERKWKMLFFIYLQLGGIFSTDLMLGYGGFSPCFSTEKIKRL